MCKEEVLKVVLILGIYYSSTAWRSIFNIMIIDTCHLKRIFNFPLIPKSLRVYLVLESICPPFGFLYNITDPEKVG